LSELDFRFHGFVLVAVLVDPSDGPSFRLIGLSPLLVPLSAFSHHCMLGHLLFLVTVVLACLPLQSSNSLLRSAVVFARVHGTSSLSFVFVLVSLSLSIVSTSVFIFVPSRPRVSVLDLVVVLVRYHCLRLVNITATVLPR
jgi:hypothetical protein